jgi:hypothetical protein
MCGVREREKEKERWSEREWERQRQIESEEERNREREWVTRRRDAMFSGKKKQHKKAQTENIDDLLVTLFLCAVQRCLILRSAKGAGQLAADTVS